MREDVLYIINEAQTRVEPMTNFTADQQTLIDHYRENPGVIPHYKTLGLDWDRGSAACKALMDVGVLEWRKVPSKSGKTMQNKIFLA